MLLLCPEWPARLLLRKFYFATNTKEIELPGWPPRIGKSGRRADNAGKLNLLFTSQNPAMPLISDCGKHFSFGT